MMQFVEIKTVGGPQVLTLSTCEIPQPDDDQILIKNHYVGVNRPDCLQRAGLYNPPANASPILGLECAGTVAAIGKNVTQWAVGDRVCALLPGGGYAQYSLTHAKHTLPVPDGLTLKQAAVLPETFFTVWFNLFQKAKLQQGETVLVHGGTSGIGTTAILLARAFGAKIIVTAGSAEKCNACRDIGANWAVNYKTEDFVEVVKNVTQGQGVDVVLDMVGGDYMVRNIAALAKGGRLASIAFLHGVKSEINIAQIMAKELVLTGSFLRPQTDAVKAGIAADLKQNVWPLFKSGGLAPIIDRQFSLSDATAAHTHMEAGYHIGKIVLRVGD